MPRSIGQKLLSFDRKLGARFVAGADEAGRGSLAGPLVVAGVLLDYDCLRNHRVRPLASLNDSKQVSPAEREELFRAVVGCAATLVQSASSKMRFVEAESVSNPGSLAATACCEMTWRRSASASIKERRSGG